MANNKLKTISIPQKLLNSIIETQRRWEEFNNELEDFLLSSDKRFLKKMEKARKEHLKRKVRDFQELKQELR